MSAIDLTEKDFPWHVKTVLAVSFIAIVVLILSAWNSHSRSDLVNISQETLWTTYTVGNPKTVVFANVRAAKGGPQVICGRINYERVDNLGWSGFTDFFIDNGVMYISPPAGQFFTKFKALCLAQ